MRKPTPEHMKKKWVSRSVQLTEETMEQLRSVASETGEPVSLVIRKAVTESLKRRRPDDDKS